VSRIAAWLGAAFEDIWRGIRSALDDDPWLLPVALLLLAVVVL
jgi:hypothetical protein